MHSNILQAKTTTRDLERRAGGGGGDTQATISNILS
jgi:hypothetical protein